MLILRVGDPHVRPNNIEESDRLMNFISEVALKNKVDRIELLGDLFHTMAVVRLEVLDFWTEWLDTLSDAQELVVLVGNHDMSGDHNNSTNALSIFNKLKKKNLKIIDLPRLDGIYGYMPYMHDKDKFVELASGLALEGARVLVCHQTFSGSTYENGFYAPDGINPDLINIPIIIGGHIHKRQRFGRVIYPGTARWDSISDANEQKGLWLVEHDDTTGEIKKEEFIDTSSVCTPLVSVTWKEGQEEPAIPANSRVKMELVGSSNWIENHKNKFKNIASISIKITDKINQVSRKSGDSLEEFILKYMELPATIDKDRLIQYMKEIKIV